MSPQPHPDLDRIKRESSTWFAARERGFTADEQDRFFEWLASDPLHAEWFARHRQGMERFKALAHWRPEHAQRPNPDLLASPSVSRRRIWQWSIPLGLAAALAIAFIAWRKETPVPVEPAPIVRKVLEDGSTIDLNHGAEVEIAYTAERRDVRLIRGEANFKVAKNAERPFIVTASGVTVRAVGTAFNVNLQSKSVAVLVTEGRVQVNRPADASGSEISAPPTLGVGERTVVALDNVTMPVIEPATAAELASALAWQPRQLEFNGTLLAQVVAEFNSVNARKLVINDPDLAALSIGASLRSDNVDGFVRILEANFDVKAERRADMIILRRGP